jgi:type IV pilus assembly protein PilB
VPGYQIAGPLSAVIAQRLIRRLCSCHYTSTPTTEYIQLLRLAGLMDPPEMQQVVNGCEACDFTGFRGRIGIYEILTFNDALRQSVRSGNQNDEMRGLARQNGIKFMQEYALDLVREGLTTIEEVQRVVAFSQASGETCESCARELSPNFSFCPFCGINRLGSEPRQRPPHAPSPARAKRVSRKREAVIQ